MFAQQGYVVASLGQSSPKTPRFLDSSVTPEVIPSFYLPASTETRYNNQGQEKDSFYEFLYYYADWLR